MKNLYICKLCNTPVSANCEKFVITNIACQCCGNKNLMLNTDRARQFLNSLEWHTTKLITYRLDTSNERERELYESMVNALEKQKHYQMSVGDLSQDVMENFMKDASRVDCLLNSYNGATWVTKKGPLHPWFERKLHSSRIKMGYYLTLTPQMERIVK